MEYTVQLDFFTRILWDVITYPGPRYLTSGAEGLTSSILFLTRPLAAAATQPFLVFFLDWISVVSFTSSGVPRNRPRARAAVAATAMDCFTGRFLCLARFTIVAMELFLDFLTFDFLRFNSLCTTLFVSLVTLLVSPSSSLSESPDSDDALTELLRWLPGTWRWFGSGSFCSLSFKAVTTTFLSFRNFSHRSLGDFSALSAVSLVVSLSSPRWFNLLRVTPEGIPFCGECCLGLALCTCLFSASASVTDMIMFVLLRSMFIRLPLRKTTMLILAFVWM